MGEGGKGALRVRAGASLAGSSQRSSGITEQWIEEGKNAVKWTRLSCHDFDDNQVRLQLFALAYNLGNFLRRLALPRSVEHLSMTTLLVKLIKIGAKVDGDDHIAGEPGRRDCGGDDRDGS
jgi:hypothetical protein